MSACLRSKGRLISTMIVRSDSDRSNSSFLSMVSAAQGLLIEMAKGVEVAGLWGFFLLCQWAYLIALQREKSMSSPAHIEDSLHEAIQQ